VAPSKNSNQNKNGNSPSAEEIVRVLAYLSDSNLKTPSSLKTLYQAISPNPRKGNGGFNYKLEVSKAISRTQRGRGTYERYFINLPIAVVRSMGLTAGSVVEIRNGYKRRVA